MRLTDDMASMLEKSTRWVYNSRRDTMTPADTEAALRKLFLQLRTPARAKCLYPKPPQRREVCGIALYYKNTLVREYFGPDMLKEFERTAREKGLFEAPGTSNR